MYASPARSTLISGAIHAAVIALILLATGVRPAMVKEHFTLFTPSDILKYEVTVPQRAGAGGGGGMHAPTPASQGNLPRFATHQYIEPLNPTPNANPIVIIEPTLIGDPKIVVAQLDLGRLGDPHGAAGPNSAGPGSGGGHGPGKGTGIGPGDGPGAGPGTDGGISTSSSGFETPTTQAVLLYKTEPEYSEEARKAKIQGSVLLRVDIDARGQVANITLGQGLGLGLDEQAVAAVRKWRFRAATHNGKPVPTRALIQVTFRLL
jgi:periplasmic protein TonB